MKRNNKSVNLTKEEKELHTWWNTLTDDQKLDAYKGMKDANKCHADALHKIVHHLLGDNYYTMTSDIYNSCDEIVASIKYRYPDVNYSWTRTWKEIKKALKNYVNR